MAYPLGEPVPTEEPSPEGDAPETGQRGRRMTEFLGYSRLGCIGCAGLLAAVVVLCICFGVAAAIMG